MQIEYTARGTNGLTRSGVIFAESLSNARRRLREDGLFPLSLNVGSEDAVHHVGTTGFSFRSRGVRKTDLLTLTSQLSIMSEAGVDFAESLESITKQCRNPALKKLLDEVHKDVSAGISVSAALQKHSEVFGDAYVASIAAGEASGTLTEVLSRLAELLEHEIRLRSSLRSVLAYPLVLTTVSFVVITALVFLVLPQFAIVFEDLGETAPLHTEILLSGAQFVRANFLTITAAFALLIGITTRYWSAETAARYWDGVLINSRLLRKSTQSLLTGRTFRLLGTMLQSGIPLLEGIRLCRASVRNRIFRELFDRMEDNVLNGRTVAEVLTHSTVVPSEAAQMVTTAEQTGRIGQVMVTIGEFYERDGERRVRDLTKLIEPVIIVGMGAVVATVVLAVMLPLLDVSAAVR